MKRAARHEIANDLRREATAVERAGTAQELAACHERIIYILIQMSNTEAEMVEP